MRSRGDSIGSGWCSYCDRGSRRVLSPSESGSAVENMNRARSVGDSCYRPRKFFRPPRMLALVVFLSPRPGYAMAGDSIVRQKMNIAIAVVVVSHASTANILWQAPSASSHLIVVQTGGVICVSVCCLPAKRIALMYILG